MPTVTGRDGTTIAYDVAGDGPGVMLVDGAPGIMNGALSLEPMPFIHASAEET